MTDPTKSPKISPKEDGPLVITGAPALRDAAGAALPSADVMALCRCGASANKPFCDGAHAKHGFSSAPDHSQIRNTPQRYEGVVEGEKVAISYTPVLCSHAAACQRLAGEAFKPGRSPWVNPTQATIAQLTEVMAGCPSGALRLEVGEMAEPSHVVSTDVAVEIEKNGPYRVKNVELEAPFNGAGATRAKYVLCRCGHSKNKPFCDGTHYDVAWTDD